MVSTGIHIRHYTVWSPTVKLTLINYVMFHTWDLKHFKNPTFLGGKSHICWQHTGHPEQRCHSSGFCLNSRFLPLTHCPGFNLKSLFYMRFHIHKKKDKKMCMVQAMVPGFLSNFEWHPCLNNNQNSIWPTRKEDECFHECFHGGKSTNLQDFANIGIFLDILH